MTALHEKREIACNKKSDVYVTHRNGPARKRAYNQVNVCLNAQKIKLFNSFSVANKGFLTSKSFLA